MEETYRRLVDVLDSLKAEGEIILVDDGSRDRSLEMMRDLRQRDPRMVNPSSAPPLLAFRKIPSNPGKN